ncbi:MAG: enoyl-CoA hydratase/isomerase family protein [Gemmatimonadales bacterium]
MSDLKHVRVEWDGEIAVVTIDRQEKLNALNAEVIRELSDVFDNLAADQAVRAVILTGAGGRAFVAGADIAEMARVDALEAVRVSREGQRAFEKIERCGKPVIAAVVGYALGGGCELALACHMRVAATGARFGLPEVGLGIIPGYGGTLRLSRVVGLPHAIEMILTGEPIDAARARELGLVSAVVEADALLDEAKKLARRVTKNGPVAVRLALEAIYRAADADSAEAQQLEAALFGLSASTKDMKEGMEAFLEKRKPTFRGA